LATRIITGTSGDDVLRGRNSARVTNPDILNGLDGDDQLDGRRGMIRSSVAMVMIRLTVMLEMTHWMAPAEKISCVVAMVMTF